MSSRYSAVETSLGRAEFRWKWSWLVRHSALLGSVLCVLAWGFGAAILAGWLTNRRLASACLYGLGALGFLTWLVLLLRTLSRAPDRRRLGAAVERVDRRLLDRVNTLIFLERRQNEPPAEAFARQIARQAQGVLAERPPHPRFPEVHAWAWLLGFAVLLGTTALLNQRYAPWNHLAPSSKRAAAKTPMAEKSLALALPPTNSVEQAGPWGEVRITDPGADLKVTKVDVVPLQIEAAANQALTNVGWLSSVNGAPETLHPLPRPKEPRYALYEPTIYLDELNLADWDVLTYYAKASTDARNSYASQVYFVEVRPFREDILKLPGGANGKPYRSLNEISSLIYRQQHVIRQTHQHAQNLPPQENLRTQDRKKLAAAEGDLRDSSRHLYAQLAAQMENQPIGQALDSLAKAEKSLGSATAALGENALDQAQNRERQALADLVAARKMFQKAVSDNPGAFQETNSSDNDASPIADSAKQLNQMAEFRNEAKAAEDLVQKTLETETNLHAQAESGPHSQFPRLAEEQEKLHKDLQDFQQQHPQAFKGLDDNSRQAQQAMDQAAKALRQESQSAGAATQEAASQLRQFGQALRNQSAQQQLANAYKLEQMLEQQNQTFGRASQPDSKIPDRTLHEAARQARQTLDELKKSTEQPATREAFGQPLREALSGQNQGDLDAKLERLQQAPDAAVARQQAGEAKAGLDQVTKAFAASEPKGLQAARQSDALKPGGQEAFRQGMAELDSLRRQLESQRPVPPADQRKQGQQALANLQNGMRSQFGDNAQGNQLLAQLERMLHQPGLDPGDLKRLQDQLQRFSLEASERRDKDRDQPELANTDPSRFPPAYRARIQRYFEKLSEQ